MNGNLNSKNVYKVFWVPFFHLWKYSIKLIFTSIFQMLSYKQAKGKDLEKLSVIGHWSTCVLVMLNLVLYLCQVHWLALGRHVCSLRGSEDSWDNRTMLIRNNYCIAYIKQAFLFYFVLSFFFPFLFNVWSRTN